MPSCTWRTWSWLSARLAPDDLQIPNPGLEQFQIGMRPADPRPVCFPGQPGIFGRVSRRDRAVEEHPCILPALSMSFWNLNVRCLEVSSHSSLMTPQRLTGESANSRPELCRMWGLQSNLSPPETSVEAARVTATFLSFSRTELATMQQQNSELKAYTYC